MQAYESVVGYHGTTNEKAASILANGFRESRNSHDWLGDGVYFYERSPALARSWVRPFHGDDDSCVLAARISLEDCWDLTCQEGVELLRPFYQLFVDRFGEDKVEALRSKDEEIWRRFDCAVINFACLQLVSGGHPVASVRDAFEDGAPLWSDPEGRMPSSRIRDRTHVQIAVRDLRILQDVQVVSD